MNNQIDPDLPDDIQDEVAGEQEATEDQIAALTRILVDKRTEAVAFRKASGIEDTWMACEEAYIGIDDSNRGEFANAKWAKPTSMSGAVTTSSARAARGKSTAFVRLTSRYVDAGAARLSEILLPVDDKPFSFAPDPVPELVRAKDDLTQMKDPTTGQPLFRDQTPDEIAKAAAMAQYNAQQSAGQPPAPAQSGTQPASPSPATPGANPATVQVPLTVADLAKAELEAAEDAANRAEDRIYTQMIDSNYPAETRKIVFDSARIGVGVLKGPVPDIDKSQAIVQGVLEIIEKVSAKLKWTDPWNLYPDPACGENIHNGDHVLEKDRISRKKLKSLKGQSGYINKAIDQVLKEGPEKSSDDSGTNPNSEKNKHQYNIWYFYGTLSREDMELLNPDALKDVKEDQEDVYVILTMVNDTVIRATLNPLDSGRFPYNAFPWSRRPGSWAGIGVGEQVSMPQRMVNAGTRTMLNNAGVSAGMQFIIDRLNLAPADGNWAITPDKVWYNLDGQPIEDVRKVFAALEIPNVGDQLMKIINYAFKLAEEQSNIPLIAQGQQGPDRVAQTFGEANLLNNNSQTMLRATAYTYDDAVTEPVVHGLYEYNLMDPEVPDDEKGSFKMNCHGSSALVERSIQEQTMVQINQLSVNPAYDLDPSKAMVEWLRSKRLDPRKFRLTDAQIAAKNAAPSTPPIQLQVAQLKAQSDQTIAQAKTQSDQAIQQAKAQAELQMQAQEMQDEQSKLANGQATPHMAAAQARISAAQIQAQSQQAIESSRAQAEQAYAATEAQMARDNAQAKLQMLQLQREIAILQYTTQQKISLQDAQAQLAKTSMIEQTKRQVALASQSAQSTENQLDRDHDMTKHLTNLAQDAQQAAPPGSQIDSNEQGTP